MAHIHSAAAQIIGSRIREARWELGLTMDDLSELAHISLTSINKIERGAQSPSAETLVRIATALDIDPSALVAKLTAVDYGEPRDHVFTARDFLREKRRRQGEADA